MEKAKQMGSNLLLDTKGLKQLERDAQKFLSKKRADYKADVYRYKDEEVTIERKFFSSLYGVREFRKLTGKIHCVTFELYELSSSSIYSNDSIFKDKILKVLRTYGVKNDGWIDEASNMSILFGPKVEHAKVYSSFY